MCHFPLNFVRDKTIQWKLWRQLKDCWLACHDTESLPRSGGVQQAFIATELPNGFVIWPVETQQRVIPVTWPTSVRKFIHIGNQLWTRLQQWGSLSSTSPKQSTSPSVLLPQDLSGYSSHSIFQSRYFLCYIRECVKESIYFIASLFWVSEPYEEQ